MTDLEKLEAQLAEANKELHKIHSIMVDLRFEIAHLKAEQ